MNRKLEELLRSYQSMLHASAGRVGRAFVNLDQESGGFPSTTPGNGSPGGSRGGSRTMPIADERDLVFARPQMPLDRLDPDDPDPVVVRAHEKARPTSTVLVPVTSVEAQVLGEPDEALADLARLRSALGQAWARLHVTASLVIVVPARPPRSARALVEQCFATVTTLVDTGALTAAPDAGVIESHLRTAEKPISTVFDVCQKWGYSPHRPAVRKSAGELLAVDPTEQWCTSHLRLGVKRDRYRGELCQWCYRTSALVATWDAPPRELVRLHVDNGKVYAHEFDRFAQAERDRQRNLVGATRKKVGV